MIGGSFYVVFVVVVALTPCDVATTRENRIWREKMIKVMKISRSEIDFLVVEEVDPGRNMQTPPQGISMNPITQSNLITLSLHATQHCNEEESICPTSYYTYSLSLLKGIKETTMATTIEEAFQKGTVVSDDEVYVFLKLPISMRAQSLQFLSKMMIPSSTPSNNNNKNNTTHNKKKTPFQAFMLDKDEITMMVTAKDFEQFKSELVSVEDNNNNDNDDETTTTYEVGRIRYRLITFDVILAPTLVGFMAVVTKVLATHNVSVLPFAAYSRDHIFVSESDFNKAMDALGKLKE